MAAVTTLLYDGVHNAVIKHTTDATESAVVIIDVTTLNPNPGVHLVLWKLKYSISMTVGTGFVRLQSDATVPVDLLLLNGWGDDNLNFSRQGGMKTAVGAGATGNVTITTVGFAAGDSVYLEFELKKGGPSTPGYNT
jgi:hypothetical protein